MFNVPTAFNLASAIENYNKQYKNKLKPGTSFGLSYLEKDNLLLLRLGFDLIKKSINYAIPTKQKNFRQDLEDIKQEPDALLALRKGRKLIKELSQKSTIDKRLEWDKVQWKFLNNEANWVSICNNPSVKGHHYIKHSLESLKSAWKKQSLFALHSHDALIWVLPTVNKLACYLQEAFEELEANYDDLPTVIAESYKMYLQESLQFIKDARQSILYGMGARLKVMDKTQQAHADVILHTVAELKAKGIIKEIMPLPPARTAVLNNHQLLKFQKAIRQFGDPSLKNEMAKLSWFNPKGALATNIITINKTPLLIPSQLAHYFPGWTGWPMRALSSVKNRLEFFEKRQSLFIALKQSAPASSPYMDVESWSTNSRLNHLMKEESLLSNELKNIRSVKTKWWQFGYKNLVKEWNATLQNRLDQCIKAQIREFELLSLQLPITDNNLIVLSPLRMHQQALIWQQIKRLKEVIEQDEYLRLNLVRLTCLSERLENQLRQTPECALVDLLKVGSNQFLKSYEYEFILQNIKILKFTFPKDTATFCDQHAQGTVTKVFDNWHETVKKNGHLLRNEKLIFQAQFILELGDQEAKKDYERTILKWLIKTPIRYSPHEAMAWIEQYGTPELKTLFEPLKALQNDDNEAAFNQTFKAILTEQAKYFLTRYLDKELTRFESLLNSELKRAATCEAHYELLNNLSKILIQKKTHQLETLNLEPHEKVIAGLYGQENKDGSVKELVELKAKANLFTQKIHTSPLLSQKLLLLESLQQELKEKTPFYAGFFGKRYGSSLLTLLSSPKQENLHAPLYKI